MAKQVGYLFDYEYNISISFTLSNVRPYEPLEALKGLGIGVEPTVGSKVQGREPEREQKVRHWEAQKERRVKENEIETERPRRKVQAPDYYSSRRKQGR